MTNKYRQFDREAVVDSDEYTDHIDKMTTEDLRSKSDIAAELAARDIRIAELECDLAQAIEVVEFSGVDYDEILKELNDD